MMERTPHSEGEPGVRWELGPEGGLPLSGDGPRPGLGTEVSMLVTVTAVTQGTTRYGAPWYIAGIGGLGLGTRSAC